MRYGAEAVSKDAPNWAASFVARVGLLLTAVALLAQSLAFAAPPHEGPRDASAAAAELSALLGAGVVICTQYDEPGAPPPPHSCEQCPLCRLAAGSLALNLPSTLVLAAPIPAVESKLVLPDLPPLKAPGPRLSPLPRGPPSQT